ncbi:MAG: hypothetical protein J3K34DRAFT_520283 [Monoraphidium minutum]|nr:MAG: hypothetical protein J3K34DRAFT_520283 [Monoraphidium minutum]
MDFWITGRTGSQAPAPTTSWAGRSLSSSRPFGPRAVAGDAGTAPWIVWICLAVACALLWALPWLWRAARPASREIARKFRNLRTSPDCEGAYMTCGEALLPRPLLQTPQIAKPRSAARWRLAPRHPPHLPPPTRSPVPDARLHGPPRGGGRAAAGGPQRGRRGGGGQAGADGGVSAALGAGGRGRAAFKEHRDARLPWQPPRPAAPRRRPPVVHERRAPGRLPPAPLPLGRPTRPARARGVRPRLLRGAGAACPPWRHPGGLPGLAPGTLGQPF